MNQKSPIDIIQERIRGFRENTDFVATLFEGLTGYANIAVDFDGNIIAYSEEGRNIYGYAPEEVIGKQSIEILFPKSFIQTDRLQEIINDLYEKEKLSYEGEMIRKNGNTFPAQIVFGLTKNRNEKIVGFLIMAHDLTERKRADEALMSSETRFRDMIQKNADGIIIVDQNGIINFVNPAAEVLFGRKTQELLGEAFGFPVLQGETTQLDVMRPGGVVAVAEMRVVETEWEGETAHLASLRDVTEISKARKSLELLASLVEDAKHVMIFIVSCDGEIEACNALARKIFGYTEEEILSQYMEALFKLEGEVGWEKIAGSVQRESHCRGELVAICKDGRKFPVDMAASRSRSEEIKDTKIICFIRDVSKEKEIDRMKSEFISLASHEMRTPMTSIKNAVDIMLKGKAGEISDKQEKFLSMAKRNIDRLADLINDLLDISKIESGKMELNSTEMNIIGCIKDVINTSKPLADKKSITLKMSNVPGLPAIYADASRIEQVMINLVGNAIKFTPENGTVTVDVHEREEMSDLTKGVKGFWEISVTDNGVGIPEELIGHIFDKFYQVESSLSTEKQVGSGLGLAISKHIVEAHGGKIQCKSKEGEGSTFSFTLQIFDKEKQTYHKLNNELVKAVRQRASVSLLIYRLMEFEKFIEHHGMEGCEKVLQIAKDRIIEGGRRKTDKVFLFPPKGEIFFIMLDTDIKGAKKTQKRIDKNIADQKIVLREDEYEPAFTSGAACYPEDGESSEQIIHMARKRMSDL